MNAIDYYTELYLAKVHGFQKQVEASISECAAVFFCSERNAKLVIHKMEDLNWIRWTSGLGRGNKSQILFLKELDLFVEEQISILVRTQQLDKALKFIQSHPLPESLTDHCYKQIKEEFGYRTETKDQHELDILRIPMRRQLATLDPAFAAITSESHISRQIYDCLINYNVKSATFEPHLAHYWEASPDRKEWLFFLRKGVHFHHGKELTAEDVKFTIERICDPEHEVPCRWYFRSLSKVSVLNSYVVSLTFSKSTPALLFFSSLNLAILASDVGFNPKHIIGTGAFRIVKYNGQQLILERYADYFCERALLNRIELYFAPNLTGAQKIYDVPAAQTTLRINEQVHENGSSYIMFNFKKSGPQRDRWLRKAIHLLIDRQAMIRELGGSRSHVSNSFIQSESPRSSIEVGSEDEVNQCLAKSVYDGETLKFYHFDHSTVKEDALWIQERVKRKGINLELYPLSLTQFYDNRRIHDADLVLGGEVLEENRELGIIHLFRDESSLIRRMIDQQQTDRIDCYIDQFIQAVDKKNRMIIFRRLENYMREERLLIYLYYTRREIAFHEALAGIKLNAFGWADFSKLWIKPDFKVEK